MKFNFSASDCTGLGLWTNAAEIMNALNIMHEANAFKLLVPSDFSMIALSVTWTLKDSTGEEMPGWSEDLLWIYSATGEANSDYTHSVQSVGGEEITIPWNIPEGTSYLFVSITMLSADYSSHASGHSSIDITNAGDDNTGTGDGGNTEDNTGEDDNNGDDNNGDNNNDGENTGDGENGNQGEEPGITNFIYPVGTIESESLPVSLVGYQGLQDKTGFSHVQIIVAEIQEDGTVGGVGHVWQSPFYSKEIDMLATLESLIPICNGKELTNFNVSYHFSQEKEDGEFYFVDAYIVGDETTVTTFSVQDVELPLVSVSNEGKVYCLDPVILTVNRHDNPNIQYVTIDVNGLRSWSEFYPDRKILRIDISEYLQTLWAMVDVFEFQQMETTIVVKLYNSEWEHLETKGITVSSIYGKNPEPETPDFLRVQWLDKFGTLHDVTFKVFDKVAEGVSKQKFVSNGVEHEEKDGERSISLAYVGANASQRIILETIVFSDHVRAYFNGTWKRVKVANTYKSGTGRINKNFEITIKYAL